jgi:hypothetical protein
MKYETKLCTVFEMPDDPLAKKAHFFDVEIALGSWDGQEDEEDQRIFFYMDGEPLEIGMILTDGFVVTYIDGDEE